jgi:K+-sensing histidine kinase KdpD
MMGENKNMKSGRIAELEAELEKARAEVKRMSEARAGFVSAVTHDLKTPMTGVKLFADLMLENLVEISQEEQRNYLSIIRAEMDRIDLFLANLGDYQNLMAGTMCWHDDQVDLVKVMNKCVKMFAVLCQSKRLGFVFENEQQSLMANMDARRFSQFLCGLLMQALSVSKRGEIKLVLSMSDGGAFCVMVTDAGEDESEERLNKIFFNPDDTEQLTKSLDIGLYVAAQVAAHYQADCSLEKSAEGSNLRAEFPAQVLA